MAEMNGGCKMSTVHNMAAFELRCIYIFHCKMIESAMNEMRGILSTVCFCQRHLRDICVMFIVYCACVLCRECAYRSNINAFKRIIFREIQVSVCYRFSFASLFPLIRISFVLPHHHRHHHHHRIVLG